MNRLPTNPADWPEGIRLDLAERAAIRAEALPKMSEAALMALAVDDMRERARAGHYGGKRNTQEDTR